MNSSTEKEKWWLYPVLFFTGALSLLVGLHPVTLFSKNLDNMEDILCSAGWCYLSDKSQFLIPFLICSFFLSLALFCYKKSSIAFASKVFIVSFAGISLLFYVNLEFLNFHEMPVLPFLIYLLTPLILFITGRTAFKERPLIRFTLKAFSVFFSIIFLITALYFIMDPSPDYYLDIQQFSKVEEIIIEKSSHKEVRFSVITAEELENYPTLKNVINSDDLNKYKFGSAWLRVKHSEWERTRDFIEKKELEPWYLFGVEDEELKDELEMIKINTNSSIPMKLRKAFEKNGISLREDDVILKLYDNMFRTNGSAAYEIMNDKAKLNVYPVRSEYEKAIKYGDRYYIIMFAPWD